MSIVATEFMSDFSREWKNVQPQMSLGNFDNIELLSRGYYDLFYAWDNSSTKLNGTLFKGHWNDGVLKNCRTNIVHLTDLG
jgi:hypothetical protein